MQVDPTAGDTPSGGAPRPPGDPTPVSLFYPLSVLSRQLGLVVLFPVVLAGVLSGWALIQPRTYTSIASFMPQSAERSGGGVSSLAAQFGLVVGSTDSRGSPRFYAELITSPEILRTLASGTYPHGEEGTQSPLTAVMEAKGDSPEEQVDWVMQRLERMIEVSVVRETGIVRVGVSHTDRVLAQALAQRVLTEVNEFNLLRQQTQAGQEREFVAGRVANLRAELIRAEEALKLFLQQNREFRNSPELLFEYDRLQREVDMRQQVVTALIQSLEQARIDEVRNTPLITVIDQPVEPVRPDPRGTVRRGLLGLFLGFSFAVALAFLREYARVARRNGDPAYEEVRDALSHWRIRA